MPNRRKYAYKEDQDRLERKLDEITTNHLPHIMCRIGDLSAQMKWCLGLTGALVGGVIALICAIIFYL